jgi:hypothetical protein
MATDATKGAIPIRILQAKKSPAIAGLKALLND